MPPSPPALIAVGLLLQSRRVTIVGAGSVGTAKIETFLNAGAHIRVVAPVATALCQSWAAQGWLEWHARPFLPTDLDDAFLAVTATGLPAVDAAVFAAAEARHCLCNAADVPSACSVYLMSQEQVGPVTLALGTSGTAPGLTGRLRREARTGLPDDLEALVQTYATLRRWLIDDHAPGTASLPQRMATLRWLSRQPWPWFRQEYAALQVELAARHALGTSL